MATEEKRESFAKSIEIRHHAAEVINKVAEQASWGGFPQDVTCEQLGQALERICINCPEKDPLLSVFAAWRTAELKRREQFEVACNGGFSMQ